MKRLLLLLLIFMFGTAAFAQEFHQAIGIRAGWTSGFEYRVFTDDYNSYKILLGNRDRGIQLHVLKEFHRYDLFEFTDQLIFVFGGGVHVGYERWDKRYYYFNTSYSNTQTSLIAGIDGLAALEYLFYEVPVSVGFEVKPYVDFWGKENFHLNPFDFAFTVKYLF